ncbi:hypothetical protein [Rubellicoccus peritrichatus]|uniref:Uncharacterized protein n=1 Tax=Rubellicoccus peritrichatus TaxID=3080537 RepID=A0AAQ3LCM4_9BACT|nr:hypothetical protein [Puniceicoccus sp. CR14]WOO43341.1 hypothetical protein RZN69_09595 [Puniceicoccus sp. CR14]
MTDAWILLGIMLVLLLGTGVGAIIFNLKLSQKVIEQFKKLGNHYGLEITIPKRTMGGLYQRNPTLYGDYEGREMSIYPRGYGMDNTRQTDIAIRLMTKAPKDFAFTFAKRNALAKLGQTARLKPCETGDADFDNAFSLRSNNPGAAKALFGEELRKRIVCEWSAESGFLSLRDRTLAYEELGLPREDNERAHVEVIADLCLEIASEVDAFTG